MLLQLYTVMLVLSVVVRVNPYLRRGGGGSVQCCAPVLLLYDYCTHKDVHVHMLISNNSASGCKAVSQLHSACCSE